MDSEAALQAAAAEAMDTAPHRRPREEDEREAAAAAPPAKEARTDGGPDDADEAGAGVGAAAAAARAAPEDAEGRSALPTNIADCEDLIRQVDPTQAWPGYVSFLDRYFTRQYAVDVMGKTGEDQFVYVHSNWLCMVGLAPSHPILREGKAVKAVDFNVSGRQRRDLVSVQVRGRKKSGAWPLGPDSNICRITCEDGSVYMLRSCVRGRLLEVNARLLEDPGLLTRAPDTEGYVAILQPSLSEGKHKAAQLLEHLITKQAYEALRAAPPASTSASASASASAPVAPAAEAAEAL